MILLSNRLIVSRSLWARFMYPRKEWWWRIRRWWITIANQTMRTYFVSLHFDSTVQFLFNTFFHINMARAIIDRHNPLPFQLYSVIGVSNFTARLIFHDLFLLYYLLVCILSLFCIYKTRFYKTCIGAILDFLAIKVTILGVMCNVFFSI